jgi:hypothetical protein
MQTQGLNRQQRDFAGLVSDRYRANPALGLPDSRYRDSPYHVLDKRDIAVDGAKEYAL